MLRRELGAGAFLRAPEDRDVAELHALIDADRDALAPWLPWAARQTEGATREFVRAIRQQTAVGDGIQSLIVVDGAIAGMAGMHGIVRSHETTSLGYWLGTAFRGRGLMTRAVESYADYAFGDLGLHRVEIQAAVDNAPSRAVAERAGFTEEGVRRGAERVGDRRHDLVVYGRLASDQSK